MFLHVNKVKYIKDHIIEVMFSDGKTGFVDLGGSFHGSAFQKLNDVEYFSRFSVDKELKTIVWPNGLDLAPEYLYFRAFKDIPELQSQFEKWGYKEKADRENRRGLAVGALGSFFSFMIRCAYKWLNRRGGKRSSFNWGQFKVALEKLGIAWPKVVEKRTHTVFVGQ